MTRSVAFLLARDPVSTLGVIAVVAAAVAIMVATLLLRRRRLSTRALTELVEEIPVGLLVARVDDPVRPRTFTTVSVNPAYCQILQKSATALIDATIDDSIAGPGRDDVLLLLTEAVTGGRTRRMDEAADLAAGGERVLSLGAFPISVDLVGLNVVDVTSRARTADTLRHQALHDRLTGLPNRALLEDRLHHAIDGAVRDDGSVALLLLDLDQFKDINDTLGHDQGDLVLIEVGRRLRDRLRAIDTVARLGGDEFAVLLTDDVSPRRTLRAAERILGCFEEPMELGDITLKCGVSLGVAMFPEHGTDLETLKRHADSAMYAAKRRGGGVEVYDPSRDESNLDRLTLVGQLSHAIEHGELELVYQPAVDLSTGRIDRVEALVRWEHPTRGTIGPTEFIDIAEVSGLIRPLTRWVVAKATTDIADLRSAGYDVGVAINISVRNLYEPTFVGAIRQALDRSGLAPDLVTLELTETHVMDDPLLAHNVLGRLNADGIRGSVDDFGTGHSSLSNLQSLPLDEIKIDRSFVAGMAAYEEASTVIVRSIIALGHNLGLEVVAEGVEDAETLERITRLGCDRAQGHHLAQPLTKSALVQHLRATGSASTNSRSRPGSFSPRR